MFSCFDTMQGCRPSNVNDRETNKWTDGRTDGQTEGFAVAYTAHAGRLTVR